MTPRQLDWRNPLGAETYECFRYICNMKKNMLEAARDNGAFSTVQPTSTLPTGAGIPSSKNKPKGVFTTFDQSDPYSDDETF